MTAAMVNKTNLPSFRSFT